MLQSHLNFNESQALPLWHRSPCWIVATTDSLQESSIWLESNECILVSHKQTLENINALRQKCKHAHTHTYLTLIWKKWMISLLATKWSTHQLLAHPYSWFVENVSLTNKLFLWSLCVSIKYVFSIGPTSHGLSYSNDRKLTVENIWNNIL